jgi:ribosomal protein S18 acetylase RimI-like enzyme
MEQQLPQLEMRLPSLTSLPEVEVAEGYALRTYRDGPSGDGVAIPTGWQSQDLAVWAQLVSECIGGQYDGAACRESLQMGTPRFAPEDLFFAERAGEVVGTTCALRLQPPEEGPGYLHMVAVSASHRGHGLGRALIVASLRRFREGGYREVVLKTDDFRLSAIRLYLDLGFRPVFSHHSHAARWQTVYQQLGLSQEGEDETLPTQPSA